MNRLFLVRHGENPANLTKQFSHRLVDYSLTERGALQAQQTAEVFINRHIDAIYTSPLKRAVETAAIFARRLGIPYQVVESFREINVGELERLPVSEQSWQTHNRILSAWFDGQSGVCFPGGEDYYSLLQRMRLGIVCTIQGRTNNNVLIVGHGGIFTLTIKDICPDVDMCRLRASSNHNCSISEIIIRQQAEEIWGEMVVWADYSHLHGEAARLVSGVPLPGELAQLEQ